MNKNPNSAMPVTPSTADSSLAPREPLSRRDFMTLAWKGLLSLSGLLGLGGLWRFLSYQPDPAPPTRFDLGLAETYPPGARARVPEALAVLQHTSTGFQAHSLVCPHLGCVVEMTTAGFECPCHGSRFGANGELLHGPAGQAMRPLSLEINPEGHLILDNR